MHMSIHVPSHESMHMPMHMPNEKATCPINLHLFRIGGLGTFLCCSLHSTPNSFLPISGGRSVGHCAACTTPPNAALVGCAVQPARTSVRMSIRMSMHMSTHMSMRMSPTHVPTHVQWPAGAVPPTHVLGMPMHMSMHKLTSTHMLIHMSIHTHLYQHVYAHDHTQVHKHVYAHDYHMSMHTQWSNVVPVRSLYTCLDA